MDVNVIRNNNNVLTIETLINQKSSFTLSHIPNARTQKQKKEKHINSQITVTNK